MAAIRPHGMRLRLYHHSDGARIAYREAGTGPPLALLHSALLSHREWEPIVEDLSHRHRVVLPDLPLHGDSEDRPRHPYSPGWAGEVLAGFLHEVCGPHPAVGGHEVGAQLLLQAIGDGRLQPSRLVLMPCSVHRRPEAERLVRGAHLIAPLVAVPGVDRLASHAVRAVLRPALGERLSASSNPAARDLVRHALADAGGNVNRARSWSRALQRWPVGARPDLLDTLAAMPCPTLLLWADQDRPHPLTIAEEALDVLPDGQLRVLAGTGFLMAYDDPVGVARELTAFCG